MRCQSNLPLSVCSTFIHFVFIRIVLASVFFAMLLTRNAVLRSKGVNPQSHALLLIGEEIIALHPCVFLPVAINPLSTQTTLYAFSPKISCISFTHFLCYICR